MKVIIRQVIAGEIEQIFQADDPYDVQIEIGIQAFARQFQISHEEGTGLLRITVDGRLIIEPETANSIHLAEVRYREEQQDE